MIVRVRATYTREMELEENWCGPLEELTDIDIVDLVEPWKDDLVDWQVDRIG